MLFSVVPPKRLEGEKRGLIVLIRVQVQSTTNDRYPLQVKEIRKGYAVAFGQGVRG